MGSIFWATLIGFAVCCVLMILGGIVGADTGLNATMCSTRAFGMTGANFSMALVIFICEAGWFAVQTAMPIVAMLVLILATWTTNTGNAYMSGLLIAAPDFQILSTKPLTRKMRRTFARRS